MNPRDSDVCCVNRGALVNSFASLPVGRRRTGCGLVWLATDEWSESVWFKREMISRRRLRGVRGGRVGSVVVFECLISQVVTAETTGNCTKQQNFWPRFPVAADVRRIFWNCSLLLVEQVQSDECVESVNQIRDSDS